MTYAEMFKLISSNPEEAFRVLGSAMNANPKDAMLIALFAKLLQAMGLHGMSYHLWDAFLRTNPEGEQLVSGLNNKGLSAASVGTREMVEEGAGLMRRSLELKEDHLTLSNLALYELNYGSREKALSLCDRAIEIQPNVHAYECRAYARLMVRDWGGWDDWEHSVGSKCRVSEGEEPYWNREAGSLLVQGEQGIGDVIAFASILPDVENEMALECDPKLQGLLQRSFPHIRVNKPARHDYRCLIGSLAQHYRRRDEDFPGTPYLVADPKRRLQWRALLDTLPGKKVGIAWNGGTQRTMAEQRSLKEIPFLDADCSFVSLEYRPHEEMPRVHCFPWGTQTQDYDDTAALVAELDLVISVTTAVVHLAGALGKECWVIAPSPCRWFYGLESRIPWYKSVEIFRDITEITEKLNGYLRQSTLGNTGLPRQG